MKMYVVLDRIAEDSGPIFEAKNDAVAHRNYRKMMESVDLPRSSFRLLSLGEFNHETQKIVVYENIVDITDNVYEESSDE